MEIHVLFGVTTVKQELEDALPNDDTNLFRSTDPFLSPKEEVFQEKTSTKVSAKLEPDCHPVKLDPNMNADIELEDALPNEDTNLFGSTGPFLLPKEVFQEKTSSTKASAKLEPDCHPVKLDPNMNADIEFEDALPNYEENLFGSTDPFLLPEEVFQEKTFSTDASVKLEPDYQPLKLEPNMNGDSELEDTLPNDDTNLFGGTDPYLLPKEEVFQEKTSSTKASAKLKPDCQPVKLDPNMNAEIELEDGLPNYGENLFGSTDPFLFPKEVFQEKTVSSTDASAKLEPYCHPLKLEPNMNVDSETEDLHWIVCRKNNKSLSAIQLS